MLTFAIKKKRTPSIAPKRHASTVSPMTHSMHLQQANVRHILRGPTLQPKLTIGQPNDKYEQEADRVTDEVMRMPEPGVQRQIEPEEEEEEMLQAKQLGGQTPRIDPSQETQIDSLRGGGQPLYRSLRNFFEPRFGYDFSWIPVHPTTPVAVQHSGSAASSNIHATRGLKSGVGEDEILRGRTVGEVIGDVARPVGTALGNVVGSVVGASTGISISSTTNAGPTWNNHGSFVWHVGFNTTGRSGWIVQDVVNTWRAENAVGNAVPSPSTPHFWEAWAVDGTGNVTPSVGADNDYWDNPDLKATYGAVEGHWATKGKLYFTTTDPATQGFTRNNQATNAGILLSSTTAPAGLGIARLHRYAQGTWDSTGAVPTHSGSAWP